MGKFGFIKKKKEEVLEKAEKKKPSVFAITFDILGLTNTIKKREDIADGLADICLKYDIGEDELKVCSYFISKYSVYKPMCVAYNEEIVNTFLNLPADVFIKFFLSFCLENKIKYHSFVPHYSCGLMESKTKYYKYFEEVFSENDFALFNLILKDKNMTMKEAYSLYKKGSIGVRGE